MKTKETLIETSKELFWKYGYKGTSPEMILKNSGVGKGSLYHHFSGKPDIAVTVLSRSKQEMLTALEDIIQSDKNSYEKLQAYLTYPREALKGCKLGRMLYDQEVVSNEDLLLPIQNYFEATLGYINECVEDLLGDAEKGEAMKISLSIVASVQGAYILTRALNDDEVLESSLEGMLNLLKERTSRSKN